MKTIHILLVEDNEGDIVLTTEALKATNINFRLSITRDGWEAIKFMENCLLSHCADPVDLILLDINLPKKNGHEVLEYLKSDKRMCQVPIVMLTTSSSHIDIMRSKKFFIDGYITKPAEPENILQIIDSISGNAA
jgi:CheY-like chemotaxis protein